LKVDPFLADRLHTLFWEPRGRSLETSNETISVEEILTLVRDYEKQSYPLPPLLGSETEQFRRSLYVLIKKAVYDGKNSRGRHLNTIITHAKQNYSHITWASFNWDCIFEASFYYSSGDVYTRSNPRVGIDLLNWRNCHGKHVFLKLHGGINWWYQDNHIHYLPFGSQPDLNQRWQAYEDGQAEGMPVILEPSYYKYEDPVYQHLKPQWTIFVENLLLADIVLVIGYSLPDADPEARLALSLGFQSNPKSKFLVIDRSDQICLKYERLFGTGRVRVVPRSLEDIDMPAILAELG
jgi:hypothetical protein